MAARRTRCAATAARGPATTLRCTKSAVESASKDVIVRRAKHSIHSVSVLLFINVLVFIKELNIHLVIDNSDRAFVRQIFGIKRFVIVSVDIRSLLFEFLTLEWSAALAHRPAGTANPLRWKNGICWPTSLPPHNCNAGPHTMRNSLPANQNTNLPARLATNLNGQPSGGRSFILSID